MKMIAVLTAGILAAGCTTTLYRTGATPEDVATDHYECEREAYTVSQGSNTLLSHRVYMDCLRARGWHHGG